MKEAKRKISLQFSFTVNKNKTDRGFILKRALTLKECRHILRNILYINIATLEDYGDYDDYKEYNTDLQKVVTLWLKGEIDDTSIMEYAYDCADEPIGIWHAFKVAEYLQKRCII